jgi:hypothetical protein
MKSEILGQTGYIYMTGKGEIWCWRIFKKIVEPLEFLFGLDNLSNHFTQEHKYFLI